MSAGQDSSLSRRTQSLPGVLVGRELVADYPDPDMEAFPMPHVVPRLSGTPGSIRTPAPRLGEHNWLLLEALGVDESRYQHLIAQGIVCEGSPQQTAADE